MSIQLFVFDKIIRLMAKRRFQKNPDVYLLRPFMAQAAQRPAKVPAHVALSEASLGGVRTETLVPQGADHSKALLYIHGGGWVAGAPLNHRALTWRLADKLAIPVYAVDYRLAPEHPFPAGLEDCVAAYRALLEKGIAPSGILIGGDSAGGNLTLATALKLKALGLPQPAGLICLSPSTELATTTPAHKENARRDAMFVPAMFGTVKAHYFPDSDGTDPFISPLRGDVSGLPPVLFQCSGDEMLRDDSVLMAKKLGDAGVPATLQVWPRVFHVWQIMADALPEARRAIDDIVTFAKARLAAS